MAVNRGVLTTSYWTEQGGEVREVSFNTLANRCRYSVLRVKTQYIRTAKSGLIIVKHRYTANVLMTFLHQL